jgi:hypothetical protein
MYALVANTTASNNTAVGIRALAANTTGLTTQQLVKLLYSKHTGNQTQQLVASALAQLTTGASNVHW